MSEFQVGQVVEFSQDGQSGEAPIKDVFDAGVVLHWRHPGGLEQWYALKENVRPAVPRPGDTVRVVGCDLQSVFTERGGVVGGEYTFQGTHDIDPTLVRLDFDNGGYFLLNLILLRRAGTPAAEEVRYYGTMPSVLPETLPNGVIWVSKSGTRCVLGGGVGLIHDGRKTPTYRAEQWHEEATGRVCGTTGGGFYASEIDWRTVPLQPSPAAEVAKGWEPKAGERVFAIGAHNKLLCYVGAYKGKARTSQYAHLVELSGDSAKLVDPATLRPAPTERPGEYVTKDYRAIPISPPPVGSAEVPLGSGADAGSKPAGGGSSVVRVDPYKKHAADLELLPDMQRIKMRLWFEKEDKLAASRRAKVEQTKSDFDRPVSSHPRSFPERAFFDADELYPTY